MSTAGTKPIVVGVDGSTSADQALRWALAEAALRDVTVHAVTAWSWDGPDLHGHLTAEAARTAAQQVLAAALEKVTDSPTLVEPQLVEGAPSRALVAAAQDAALLVVGNHRHGTTYRALIGSVADACLRTAACPVVMVTTDGHRTAVA